jgi:hypothetical protein
MTRRAWPGRPSASDAISRPRSDDTSTGIQGRLASAVRFVQSRFTCYFVAHPDYGSAVDQAERALRSQVDALQARVTSGEDVPCAGDGPILCGLHGFVSHYAARNHIRSPDAQLEVTAEVLIGLFGEQAGSRMTEGLEALASDPSASDWIRAGQTMAGAFEASGSAPIRDLIDQRLKSREQAS